MLSNIGPGWLLMAADAATLCQQPGRGHETDTRAAGPDSDGAAPESPDVDRAGPHEGPPFGSGLVSCSRASVHMYVFSPPRVSTGTE